MSKNEQTSIKNRWWFKLMRLLSVGIFQGITFLVRRFLGLSTRMKIVIGGSLLAFTVLVGVLGYQEGEKARSLGFATVNEMRKAAQVNCPDKACYAEYLLAQKQAEDAKIAAKEASSSSEKGKTLGQWLDETKSSSTGELGNTIKNSNKTQWLDDFGRTTKQACSMFVRFKSECISGENYSSCMELKYSNSMGSENRNAYMYDQQMCRDDGTSILDR